MNDRFSQILPPLAVLVSCLFAVYIAIFRPWYLSSDYYLGGLIILQILLAALWNYRQRFFPLLVVVFFWASTDVPLSSAWTSGRWFVLAAGALVGFVIYMKDRHHYFSAFHLVALFCALAALVSALVSSYPGLASLKAVSLLLLFLYGTSGARLAVMGREAKFLSGLLLGCEILVYYNVIAYFILRIDDNPNSVGALIGVVALPIMLWGMLVSETAPLRRRRTLAFALALGLLLCTYSRAGIAGATVSCLFLCVTLRRYRLLIKGLGVALLSAILVASLVPPPSDQPGEPSSVTATFLFKGKQQEGVLGSRKPMWDQTVDSIRQNPWFGTGFGTTTASEGSNEQFGFFSSNTGVTKEHGNSYLAIAEWVGLLGVVPFFTLVFFTALNVGRVAKWMLRTGDPFSAAVPIAAVLSAGLVHAAFEDWLFAVGYHLCVFFWSLAFVLVDVLPARAPETAHAATARRSNSWVGSFGMATPAR